MSRGNMAPPQRDDATPFDLLRERTDTSERLRLVGEMDLSVIGRVDREMQELEAGEAERIVLDLDELEFLDASGIRLLMHLDARSKRNGGRLRMTRARNPYVRRVIELTGAGDVLPFLD
jgi:anti-anti-sigma factor